MKNLEMFCLTLEPSHLDFIKALNYIPVGLGEKKFSNEWLSDKIGKSISEKNKNVVFLLWGGYAKKKGVKIDQNKHCVLTSGHPSPLSANRGYWFGNKHFSKANNYLKNSGLGVIGW